MTRLTPAEARTLFPGQVPKRHKYNVAGQERRTYNGVVYHSALEVTVAQELDYRQRAGEIDRWERQCPYPLAVNGTVIGTYYADFLVRDAAGKVREVIECKGHWTRDARKTWAVFLALYQTKLEAEGTQIILRRQQKGRR
jgi:hypothetical protein